MPKIKLSLRAWSEHDFVHALVDGIDFRMQDIEYKLSLIQQNFTREVKYATFVSLHPLDAAQQIPYLL